MLVEEIALLSIAHACFKDMKSQVGVRFHIIVSHIEMWLSDCLGHLFDRSTVATGHRKINDSHPIYLPDLLQAIIRIIYA